MFFTLPDGSIRKAKKTSKGMCTHGVACQMLYPCPDGSHTALWVLYSQHTDWEKAAKAGHKAMTTAPHLNDCKLIRAK